MTKPLDMFTRVELEEFKAMTDRAVDNILANWSDFDREDILNAASTLAFYKSMLEKLEGYLNQAM